MLKRYSQILVSCLVATDLAVTALAFGLAFWIRFYAGLPVSRGVPQFFDYTPVLPPLLLLSYLAYRYNGLYLPRRIDRMADETRRLFVATAVALLVLASLAFFYREVSYSRAVFVIFLFTNPLCLGLSRASARSVLRKLRRRGYNQRHALIVGSGKIGQALALAIRKNPWSGLKVVGFLDDRQERIGGTFGGIPVLGHVNDIRRVLAERGVDQVFIAMPYERFPVIREVLNDLLEAHVDVRLVPDLMEFVTLKGNVVELDGIPIINLREGPLYGWNTFLKRVIDLAVATTALVLLLPILGIVTLLVWLTSGRPILYKQERMGLDGRMFAIWKFRTMVQGAEEEGRPVWSTPDDPRVTPMGRLLRATFLDEVPQLWNVVNGEMSLVGPRPERPYFIEQFQQKMPKYALRHRTKAGITGWAQVNGWRGDTSIRKRLQYDLYYIENWSIWFDLRILFLTLMPFALRRERRSG